MSGLQRSLATVLFTDIVGSTERAAELRDTGWRDLRQEHDRRVRRELRRFGGHEINTAGDSFLATFEGPARAIACAGAIRAAVRELGLEIRAGLHMGEIEGSGRELGGLALNIGARVAAEAGPGEILVSRSVHDALAGSAFDFEDRGVRTLKGVPGEWRVFAVTSMPGEAGEALPGRLARLPLTRRRVLLGSAAAALLLGGLYIGQREPGPELTPEEALAAGAHPGIAVLPFTVHGEGLEVWREGMVDVLSTNLDGAAGLRAIDSRTVLARWGEGVEGSRTLDLATALAVARQTGARYALIGDAVASGAGVRFGADIYDVRDGAKLGDAQVEGSPDSLFLLVDRLSIEVLRAIYQEGWQDLPQVPVLASVTTTSLPALKSYLSGEVLYRSGDFKGAVAAYERAIAADSTFALAIMRVGDAKGWITGQTEQPPEYYERALEHANRLPAREAMLARANRDYQRGTLESLDSLRLAVQRYPDDPDFWYLLGETYYHMEGHLLVTEQEAGRMFSHALALDPNFAHYYLHLAEIAFHEADSVRAATLIQAYGRIAPEDEEHNWQHRVAFSLAFGDSADRSRALAALDTFPIEPASIVSSYLRHPRFGRVQEQSLRRLLARPDAPSWLSRDLLVNLLNRGRFRAALQYVDKDELDWRFDQPYVAYLLVESGMASPPERIDPDLSGMGDPQRAWNAFWTGAYAADRGRWPAHDAAVRLLRADAHRMKASGDSLFARNIESAASILEAYGQWKRGRGAEALPILEAAFHDPLDPRMIKWWLGELSLELGKRREAALYFGSIWGGENALLRTPAEFYLGEIYTELGEFGKARESYEYVLLAWQDADPEMQPRTEAARRGLARLPKLIRRDSS